MECRQKHGASAVLFDADGVLVDACELHYVAFNRALATMGWAISKDEHEAVYNGLPTQKKLDLLTGTKNFPLDRHSAVHGLKQEFTWQAIEECLVYDGRKRELVSKLRSRGLKVAVCSNSLKPTVEKMLYSIGIRDLIDLTIGNDEVKHPKPNPEMYLKAADLLGVPISECIIVEDSPVGLQAAYAADPLKVIHVDGPHEVNIALLGRMEPFMSRIKEAA